MCVSDRSRSCFGPVAAGGNVGSGHSRVASFRVFLSLESTTARVSGDHREVIVGRQLFAGDRIDEGCLRVTLVACGCWCGVSWQAIRSADGDEVATPPSSSTERTASGFRSGERTGDRSSFAVLFRLRAGPGGVSSLHRVGSNVAARRFTASRRVPYCTLPRKWSPPNDRVGSPSAATSMTRTVGSNASAARIASRIRGRFEQDRALRSLFQRIPSFALALCVSVAASA